MHRHTFEGKVRPKEDCVTLTGHSDVSQLPTVLPFTACSSLTRDSLKEARYATHVHGRPVLQRPTVSHGGIVFCRALSLALELVNSEVLPLLGNVTLKSDTPSGPGLADNHETPL